MSTNILIIIYILIVIIILLIIWFVRTEVRLKRLFRGRKGKDLEGIIQLLVKEVKSLQKTEENMEMQITAIDKRLKKSIQGVEIVRFNPFRDSGGNQSFAVAFIDEEGNGVVISSLYSREKVSIFAKPIKQHISEYTLTMEEKEVLKKASLLKE